MSTDHHLDSGSPPRVFLSYAHFSEAHKAAVWALAERLRSRGVNAWFDQYEQAPEEGWRVWMERQIERADFVLLICSQSYYERVHRLSDPGQGRGVAYESTLMLNDLYDQRLSNEKLIPILLQAEDQQWIPRPLRDYTSHCVETEEGFDKLLRQIYRRPSVVPGPLGPKPALPPISPPRVTVPIPPVQPGHGELVDDSRHRARRRRRLVLAVAAIVVIGAVVIAGSLLSRQREPRPSPRRATAADAETLRTWARGETSPIGSRPSPADSADEPAAEPLAPLPAEPPYEAGESWNSESIGMRFRFVPPGTFQMGSLPDEEGRSPDEALHEVELTRSVWVGETEVTQEQWQRVVGNRPSRFRACGTACPVESVNWFEAVAFANLLSKQDGLAPCYRLESCSGTLGGGCAPGDRVCTGDYRCEVGFEGAACAGYRLPTEAEWEYAVRAGTKSAHYADLDDIAWYLANGGDTPHPVGQLAANAFHLVDGLGNVWEWCADAYQESLIYRQIDPYNDYGEGRIARGGAWSVRAMFVRAGYRNWLPAESRNDSVGFRLVRSHRPSAP